MESPIIGGSLELGPGFPLARRAGVGAGSGSGTGQAFISVRSLKSVEPDGRPYSDKMDEIMYENLREEQNQQIRYRLVEIVA